MVQRKLGKKSLMLVFASVALLGPAEERLEAG